MKKLLIISAFMLSAVAFGQQHTYVFKIVGVTDPGQAKQTIDEFRTILDPKQVMYFNDTTDEFRLVNDTYPLNMAEVQEDLNAIGIYLEGEFSYYVNE